MFSLTKKAKAGEPPGSEVSFKKMKMAIRDRLLTKEINDLKPAESSAASKSKDTLPTTWELSFPDPDKLYHFNLIIRPKEGYWENGKFTFEFNIPEEYNMVPPIVKCTTRLWHPNIDEEGSVCLSLLRQPAGFEDLAWTPAKTITDVVWGLNSLFIDLFSFDDPLNEKASKMFKKDEQQFQDTVQDYIEKYC